MTYSHLDHKIVSIPETMEHRLIRSKNSMRKSLSQPLITDMSNEIYQRPSPSKVNIIFHNFYVD